MKCGTSQLPEKIELSEKSYWQEIEVVSEKESKVNLRERKYFFSPLLRGQRTKHFLFFGFFLAFFLTEINTCFN